MTPDELKAVLDLHAKWRAGEPEGKRAYLSYADLSYADLSGANLSGTNLSYADLRDANLSYANLSYANLSGANLSGANLSGTNLSYADLRDANLSGANLSGANLSYADLSAADLSGANLSDANLRVADLSGANLSYANLRGANLRGAYLSAADLRDADLSPLVMARLSIVPEVGPYTGWKKCVDGVIVRLTIPAEARRSNATGRKCRAEFAIVEAIEDALGAPAEKAISSHDRKTVYRVGERVCCHEWDEDRWNECSGGIHHFITRIEAEHY
jgi:hypothetical protein